MPNLAFQPFDIFTTQSRMIDLNVSFRELARLTQIDLKDLRQIVGGHRQPNDTQASAIREALNSKQDKGA